MAAPPNPEASEGRSTSVSSQLPYLGGGGTNTAASSASEIQLPEDVSRGSSIISATGTQRNRKINFAASPVGRSKLQRDVSSVARSGTSPPPIRRFNDHVSFDNFSKDEPTDKNTVSFTLNSKHRGYKYKRRSRTFMVGIGENDYSDYALQWMLEELVDDGDEIICLRVLEKDSKMSSDRSLENKLYQEEARQLMETIKSKNDDNRAISITLEFAVGKVHQTFQHMFQIYEPAMLIVGTRGRSLGGFQGLVGRNSFSKWCLQYSPIPVVVVRPTEKREKKKMKRTNDPARQSYVQILQESGHGVHEANTSPGDSIYESSILPSKDADAEAHAVAVALELPARFDPTLKPYSSDGILHLRRKSSPPSDASDVSDSPEGLDGRQSSQDTVMKSPESEQLDSPDVSDAEGSEDEEDGDGEFEAFSGHRLLGTKRSEGDGKLDKEKPEEKLKMEEAKVKMDKLHSMEQGEAKALALGRRRLSIDSQDSQEGGGAVGLLGEDG